MRNGLNDDPLDGHEHDYYCIDYYCNSIDANNTDNYPPSDTGGVGNDSWTGEGIGAGERKEKGGGGRSVSAIRKFLKGVLGHDGYFDEPVYLEDEAVQHSPSPCQLSEQPYYNDEPDSSTLYEYLLSSSDTYSVYEDEEFERGRERTRTSMAGPSTESSPRKSKSHKREKSARPDETPEERDARKEERRARRVERDARKASEAAALGLGTDFKREKNREKSSKPKHSEEKKPKLTLDQMLSGLSRSKSSAKRAPAPPPRREVRSKSYSLAENVGIGLNEIIKDSTAPPSSPTSARTTANPSISESRSSSHRHHHYHQHTSLQDQDQCGRCLRKQKRREERKEREQEPELRDRPLAPVSPPAPVATTNPSRAVRAEEPLQVERGRKQRPVLGFVIEKKPEKLVECVTCLQDDVPAREAAHLTCGHWFCHECLTRIFTLSLTDPAHMPPKCCTAEHIPLKHVDKLLSYQTKKQWNKKYLEYTTANRIYCPATDCGEWIPPKDIHHKIGKCPRCKTKVCATCNSKAHGDGECPKDEDLLKFIDVAQKNKFQRCYNCRAMVELERGCNHMTCLCTAEFCYCCGAKWKTCACPWFNYEPEDDNEYVVPDWNDDGVVPLPLDIAGRRARRDRARAEQMREDEELARRLAREMNIVDGVAPPPNNRREPFGAEYYQLPQALQIDPFAALGTIGNGLRNGIRRWAADYVEATRAEPRPVERRNTEPIQPLFPRASRSRSRSRSPPRQAIPAPSPPPPPRRADTMPNPNALHLPRSRRHHQRQQSPLFVPHSPYLSDAQQAHVERYLRGLDVDNPEPAVDQPFRTSERGGEHASLRRSNTDRVYSQGATRTGLLRANSSSGRPNNSAQTGWGLLTGISTGDAGGDRTGVGRRVSSVAPAGEEMALVLLKANESKERSVTDGNRKNKLLEDDLLVRMLEIAGVEEVEYESAGAGRVVAKRGEWR